MTTPPLDAAAAKEAKRDIRLDFFRGLGMFIILIAHIPWNSWKNWIPARFGYSDATEIFVFCSGAASAIAFLKIFNARGWWIGTMRIAFRIWQLYWCHIALLLATAATLVFLDNNLPLMYEWFAGVKEHGLMTMLFDPASVAGIPLDVAEPNRNYHTTLNLKRFVNNTAEFLPSLFGLRYVPNFFDILVMYMVILALIPVVVALSWRGKWWAMSFCIALWLMASQPWLVFVDFENDTIVETSNIWVWFKTMIGLQEGVPVFQAFNLPAEPSTRNDRNWFFNPFAWQLIFFTGFAFSVGWIPKPPVKWYLILLAIAVLIPAFFMDTDGVPARRLLAAKPEVNNILITWGISEHTITEWRTWHRENLRVVFSKEFFGLFRYLHFLAVAYLVWIAAGDAGKRLPKTGLGGGIVTIVRRVGQQSLAVFIFSIWVSWLIGAWISEMDVDGKGGERVAQWVVITANVVGIALLIAVTYIARYFRNPPWSRREALATSGVPNPEQVTR